MVAWEILKKNLTPLQRQAVTQEYLMRVIVICLQIGGAYIIGISQLNRSILPGFH